MSLSCGDSKLDNEHNAPIATPMDERPDDLQSTMPAWAMFLMGVAITLLAVYVGVSRPAARRTAILQGQINRLEDVVLEIAGHEDSARATNSLLGSLAEQGRRAADASVSLDQIHSLHQTLIQQTTETRELNEQLTAEFALVRTIIDELSHEAQRLQEASRTVDELAAVKENLLANAERSNEAAQVLATMDELQRQLVDSVELTEQARLAGSDLIALEEDLVYRGTENQGAREALGELIDIRDQLDHQGNGLATAQQRVNGLLELKDEVLAETDDLVDAIETFERAQDLQDQFEKVSLSFDRIRRWMTEALVLEPMVERTVRSLQPLTELGNLRRLTPDELRHAARMITQQRETSIANKPRPETSDAEFGTAVSLADDEQVD